MINMLKIIFITIVAINMNHTINAQTTNNAFSSALISDSAKPEKKEYLTLFGQFIGSWTFDWIGCNEDGSKDVVKGGEWIFSWILEGRAIQDVWICPGRNTRYLDGYPEGEYGTTIRHYDPEIKKWRIIWLGPVTNKIGFFTAEKIGDEIVLSDNESEEVKRKWIFSEITENSFRWREEKLKENSSLWQITQEFICIKK